MREKTMPNDAEKQLEAKSRILKAARELYFSEGVSKVSTDLLAKTASVSKSTLYKYFPNTKAILRELVHSQVHGFRPGDDESPEDANAFHSYLVNYGINFMRFLNQKDVIRFDRLMLEEARLDRDAVKVFFEAAYEGTIIDLSRILSVGVAAGWLKAKTSPIESAELLVSMWKGVRFSKAQFGLTTVPFRHIEDWSQKCVLTLLGTSMK